LPSGYLPSLSPRDFVKNRAEKEEIRAPTNV